MDRLEKLQKTIRYVKDVIHDRECRVEQHGGYSPTSERECNKCEWSIQKGKAYYAFSNYQEVFFYPCAEGDRLENRVLKAEKLKKKLELELEREFRLK